MLSAHAAPATDKITLAARPRVSTTIPPPCMEQHEDWMKSIVEFVVEIDSASTKYESMINLV